MEIFIVLGVILVLAIIFISLRNTIVSAEIRVDEAASGIDVALTKRFDMLTKMLDVCKGYAKHEVETLTKITEIRAGMTMDERRDASAKMDELTRQINILKEAYPDLKASENFRELQKAIADVEEHLQASRRAYNANVRNYNDKIMLFPSSLVASMMGRHKKDFFEAEEKKRDDVKMQF